MGAGCTRNSSSVTAPKTANTTKTEPMMYRARKDPFLNNLLSKSVAQKMIQGQNLNDLVDQILEQNIHQGSKMLVPFVREVIQL